MPSWVIWVIVAIIVIAIVVALLIAANKKKTERNRSRAGELREQASQQATEVQAREARARETEASAAAARAEADRKQAEADRLAAEAQDRQKTAAEAREQHLDHLRRADELDPDVNTKSDDYRPGYGTDGTGANGGTDQNADGTRRMEQGGSNGEATTVTHPDGSTEAVNSPDAGQTTGSSEGGAH